MVKGSPVPGAGRTSLPPFLVRFVATFGFTGMFPIAPATFASAVTLGLFWFAPPLPLVGWIVMLVLLTVIGTYFAHQAEQLYGHDASPIVIDEVVGVLLTIAMLPHTLGVYLIGFFLFRVLDVVKPPPAYQFQSLRGGFGVMADDVMAGIYGQILLRLAVHFWPAIGRG
ncbi:MAG: phosphatidylglycerophosphatase A [Candidatus Eisenbacteria bacterium]|nr:phosphatidylglycerophosphatase A [Candidatus Eisenbacteria bacterium]MCC7142559.1 phosphatidylglycerophosphatase A [Candidatus Eisenbacteria bacterium]